MILMGKILSDFFFISKRDKISRIRYFCYFLFLSLLVFFLAFKGATAERISTMFISLFFITVAVALYINFNITAKRIRHTGFRYAYTLSFSMILLIIPRWIYSDYAIVRFLYLILTMWVIIAPTSCIKKDKKSGDFYDECKK